ncbi:MAG: CotH kinase family protein [Verrucomicrobiia bacterium]
MHPFKTVSGRLNVLTGLALFASLPRLGSTPNATDPTATVFAFHKVHQLHLTMPAGEWAAMQPAGPPRFPMPGMEQAPAEKPGAEERPTHRGNMLEYPIAYGELADGEKVYKRVAVRFKGNFTYMASAHSLKRSLKIDLDPPGSKANAFHGLQKINLHAGVTDPTRQRETLSYEVFREAGVPAPRTAFAELTLTVPGKYDRELVGLYVLVEQVDKRFLRRWFANAAGLLFKPQGVRGPDYLGDRWENYEHRYRPNRPATPDEAARVIDFAKLVNNADDAAFNERIHSFLDVDGFLRFLAANAMLVNLDSPLAMPQNFYIYLHPDTRKFIFMPWDLDLSLAAWPMGGPPEKQMDLSLMHPHAGEHKLIDRLLGVRSIRESYQAILKELAAGAFTKTRLLAIIDLIEKTTLEPLRRESEATAGRKEPGNPLLGAMGLTAGAPSPRVFVEKRVESIQAQLSGSREGYTPAIGFGWGPGRRPPPPARGPQPNPPRRRRAASKRNRLPE